MEAKAEICGSIYDSAHFLSFFLLYAYGRPKCQLCFVMIMSHCFVIAEFGFVVMGHEFDHYPKKMIRDVKKWNWFLEEPGKEGDDDDGFERTERRGARRKRGKDKENEDDEWTGESETDEEAVAKLRKVNTPKYSTRSKACSKPQKDAKRGKCSAHKKTPGADEEGKEDEDDETLGGFIVVEEDMEEDELEETEDEEEFVEDDDEEE